MDSFKVGLPPLARSDARLFILGSLPGDASLAARRYYAHPTNQFWRLLGGAMGEDLQALSYDLRLRRLAEFKIGLWDVIASASRRGSLDQSIRSAGHNPIAAMLGSYPGLRTIAFNGLAASSIGRKLVDSTGALEMIDLPSSSAANTRPFAEKAEAWAVLRQFVTP